MSFDKYNLILKRSRQTKNYFLNETDDEENKISKNRWIETKVS